jgi:hypothetical protein
LLNLSAIELFLQQVDEANFLLNATLFAADWQPNERLNRTIP